MDFDEKEKILLEALREKKVLTKIESSPIMKKRCTKNFKPLTTPSGGAQKGRYS